MHGIIVSELRRYALERLGDEGWRKLLEELELPETAFIRLEEHPDREVLELVDAAAKILGKSSPALLEDFGAFLAPRLLSDFSSLIDRKWRTLDVITNTEAMVHTVLRQKDPKAHPPRLVTARIFDDEVVLIYTSPRKLCGIAKGLARGIAQVYREEIAIREITCMLEGARACEISMCVKTKNLVASGADQRRVRVT